MSLRQQKKNCSSNISKTSLPPSLAVPEAIPQVLFDFDAKIRNTHFIQMAHYNVKVMLTELQFS